MIQEAGAKKSAEKVLSPRRRRRLLILRISYRLKKLGWRLTASWCWIHFLGWLLFRKDLLSPIENRMLTALVGWLVKAGFEPSSARALAIVAKTLWVLTVSDFSFFAVPFLVLYVILWPLLVFAIWKFKKYRIAFATARDDAARKMTLQPLFHLSRILLSALIAWGILYGNTQNRGPLLAAMLICASLLLSGVVKASYYSTAIETQGQSKIEQVGRASSDYVVNVMKGIRLGGPPLEGQLQFSRCFASFLLRVTRRISLITYGGAGQRRASLLVLVQYTTTLFHLGLLIVLFWGLTIKHSLAPTSVPMHAALLASASHVIPGVVDTTGLSVKPFIQVIASGTAWLVLVLFAGPAASNFPALQEASIKKMRKINASILLDRRRLYRWIQLCNSSLAIIKENPKWDEVLKLILIVASEEHFGGLQAWQPDVMSALLEKPELLRALSQAGLSVPESLLSAEAKKPVGMPSQENSL